VRLKRTDGMKNYTNYL